MDIGILKESDSRDKRVAVTPKVVSKIFKLGWKPEISIEEMCAEMVREDLKSAKRNAFLKANGYEANFSVEN